jgi:hypothetical protein
MSFPTERARFQLFSLAKKEMKQTANFWYAIVAFGHYNFLRTKYSQFVPSTFYQWSFGEEYSVPRSA